MIYLYKAELDAPIVLIFFARADTLKKVFLKVKKARPNKLFLIQDGARVDNAADLSRIMQCRNIVEDIDWECELYKDYSEVNLGCGVRIHTGISWVFEYVEQAIILEDDCVPCDSFFIFCKEMLEKYKNDLRIGIISGLNYFNEYNFGGYSYGFTRSGPIWGWATWRDRWKEYDFNVSKIDNTHIKRLIKQDIATDRAAKKMIELWEKTYFDLRGGKTVSYWDYQWCLTRYVNSWLDIVPKYNLISNIGIGDDATHTRMALDLLPSKLANWFYMETRELELPLKNPDFVIADRLYDIKCFDIAYPSIFQRIINRITRYSKKFLYIINNKFK